MRCALLSVVTFCLVLCRVSAALRCVIMHCDALCFIECCDTVSFVLCCVSVALCCVVLCCIELYLFSVDT